MWGPHNQCFVDPVFNKRVRDGNVPATQQAALRSAIYKELFEELLEDEQQEWVEHAEQEHQAALQKASNTLNSKPSTAPEDRQRYVTSLSVFFLSLTYIFALIQSHQKPSAICSAYPRSYR